MKHVLVFIILISLADVLSAQYVYTINADSVKLTSCDSSELIIENHTQAVHGFLFNTGNGRTVFKRGVVKLNDSFYLIGGDTLKIPSRSWVQGGNSFGATGVLGTLDNNHLDFYTNNSARARLTNTGNLLLGTTVDNTGYKFQIMGATGGIYFNPNLSTVGDRIRFGGYINTGDGQDAIISTSSDTGRTYSNILAARNGNIGLGQGGTSGWYIVGPTLRINSGGIVSVASQSFYFGNTGGPYNSSCLVTYVSNTNEWNEGLGNYPSGQNYYYFGTKLQTPETGNKRAPLWITGDELHFFTGPTADVEAGRFSEAGNLLLGSTTDNGTGKLQVTGNITSSGSVRFAGLTGDNTQTRVLVSDGSGNLYYRDAATLAGNGIVSGDLANGSTTLPSLAVNGTISAQRMKLSQAGWPDYVFRQGYRLPQLKEIEAYIQQHGHLPGIPSATEVEKKGIDVGDHEAALLKKIEELTLYNIAQEKELEDQHKLLKTQTVELSALKEEVAALKKMIISKSIK